MKGVVSVGRGKPTLPLLRRCHLALARTKEGIGELTIENRIDGSHLHEWRTGVEEVLPALRLGALLVPVYDSLVRNTILIVQNLFERSMMRPRA